MATPHQHTWAAATALATVAMAVSLVALPAVPQAQKPETRAVFDVVSIKENTSGLPNKGGDRFATAFYPAGRFTARNATLQDLVLAVYREEFPASRIAGFADWMTERRFDVEARIKAGAALTGDGARVSPQQLQVMVRGLLEERFALRTRRGERSEEVLVLSVAPGGHKMKPAANASACGTATDQGRPVASECHMLRISRNGLDGTVVETGDIAGALQFRLQRPVIDRTRLSGLFEVSASWKDETGMFAALREQLGLRLDVERVPMPTLIVESAAPPRDN